MCGLIGYVGQRSAQALLVAGLERLEYRGYDSAGICLLEPSGLVNVKAVGELDQLKAKLNGSRSRATTGVGHTRWATHGRVCAENAHPLSACREEELAVVLNGIVENFRDLTAALVADGHRFRSETDAETVAHLVERHYQGDLVAAVRAAYDELEGDFAFVVVDRRHPRTLVGARRRCPLVVGLGSGEVFVASMISAFLDETERVQLVEDGEIVELSPKGARFFSAAGAESHRQPIQVDWDDEVAEKEGYESFMLKEIHEQPAAVANTLAGRLTPGTLLSEAELSGREIGRIHRIVIVACGTAYHAGLVGRYSIEARTRIPCEVGRASCRERV